jgi:hypothetical protein
MAGDDIRITVDDADERLANVFACAAQRVKEGAVGGSFHTFFYSVAFHFSISTK